MALCSKGKTIVWSSHPVRFISTSCMLLGYLPSQVHLYQNMDLQAKQNIIERKRRKLRKLEKIPPRRIPITDFRVNSKWKLPIRQREPEELSEEEKNSRIDLEKEWGNYANTVRMFEDRKLELLLAQQNKALMELKAESLELYNAALKPEPTFRRFSCNGPVQTLPIAEYLAPLGGYLNLKPQFSTDREDK